MFVNSYTGAGGAFTGDVRNNAGFSWSYQERATDATGFTTWTRCLEVQAMFGGQVTQPARAVTDDFGTIVVVD